MALHRSFDGNGPFRGDRLARVSGAEEERRVARTATIATGTLACPTCDAPVALGTAAVGPTDPLACPFCGHDGAVRDFLSLRPPTRPTRVVVRIVDGGPRVSRERRSAE